MMEMIKKFGIGDNITVIKNPKREEVITAYSESEFLILPSRWELSPLTPLEGFAFKKPTISTNSHGIPSTITHNENGILVDNEDFDKLSESILELMNNKEKCAKLGLSGYDLVQKECNSEVMVKKIVKVYEEIVNR